MPESEADGLSTAREPGHEPDSKRDATGSADWSTDPGTETDRDPLLMLLMRWEEAVGRGEDPDPQTLCGDDPALMAALAARIAKRKRLRALMAIPIATDAEPPEPPLPEFPGHEVLDRLGRGGMGIVYRARDVRLGRIVALKTLAEARYATREQVERFLDEARAVARLRHPNILGIHAIGEHDGQPYLSLEYVEGGSLAHRLAEGPMAPRAAAELVETLARAIDAAHRAGVVHRDLKPANVLLTAEGTPRVCDFGLAKLMDSDSALTRSGQVMGTPSYMAPEQAEGHSGRVGPPADVYALGAILYQSLTARPPFLGESALETMKLVSTTDAVPPTRLRPNVPRDLETICLKCLEKEPSRRYETAAALADDLRRFLDGRPIAARPVGPAGRLLRWSARNRTLAAVSAALVAAFALGTPGLFALWLAARSDRIRADRERAHAVDALGEARKAHAAADEARRRAEAARARAVSAIGNLLLNEGGEMNVEELRPIRQALIAKGLFEARQFLEILEDDPDSEILLTQGHLTMAAAQRASGQAREALETGRKALAMAEAFDARRHSDQSRNLLALVLHRLCELTPSHEEARAYARRSNALYEATAAGGSEGPTPEPAFIALNHHNIGDRFVMERRLAEAGPAFESAIRVCEGSIRRGDRSLGIRVALSSSLRYLGRVRIWSGRPGEAVEPLRRAIEIDRALADEAPNDPDGFRRSYLDLEELAWAYHGLGRIDDAIAGHEAALEALRAAAVRHRGTISLVAEIQGDIAIVDLNLADECETDLARHHARHRAAYAEAYEICDKLELVEPLSDDLKQVMAFALAQRIDARIEDGERPDLADYARADRLLEDLRGRQPANLIFRTLQVHIRREWADELDARGRPDEALACRDRCAATARGDGEALFEAGVIAADTARWHGSYPIKADARAVRERRRRLDRRAVDLIAQAIEEGFRDAGRLHREPRLASLADDPGFRAVAAALDDRVFPADPFAPRP